MPFNETADLFGWKDENGIMQETQLNKINIISIPSSYCMQAYNQNRIKHFITSDSQICGLPTVCDQFFTQVINII